MNLLNKKPYSVAYHIKPEFGLLNDPNGLIRFKGVYHVFYQLNPFGFTHKHKSWGHVYSEDMVNWKQADIALHPDMWFDKDGVYSGCAIEYQDKLYVFYTGNVVDEKGVNQSYQCLAVSPDGFSFEKAGPVLQHPEGYTRHVRDPKVFKLDDTEDWYMVLGAQTEQLQGDILLYRSHNLYDWEQVTCLRQSNDLDYGYMMECPNLIKLGRQWIFIVSPQGIKKEIGKYQNIYQSGYFTCDIATCNITGNKEIILTSDFVELDYGFEFYAPQVFNDGEKSILYAWMGVMELDKELSLPTIKTEQWAHNLTIPRELYFVNGKLRQQPWEQSKNLRMSKGSICEVIEGEYLLHGFTLQSEVLLDMPVPCAELDICCEDCFRLHIDEVSGRLCFTRKDWLTHADEIRQISFVEPLKNLRMLLDNSTMEVFINDGEVVFSCRFFASIKESLAMKIACPGTTANVQYYPLAVDDF